MGDLFLGKKRGPHGSSIDFFAYFYGFNPYLNLADISKPPISGEGNLLQINYTSYEIASQIHL